MARRLRDSNIDSKQARAKLKPSPRPYWTVVERGKAHLGYRRLKKKKGGNGDQFPTGSWFLRRYVGNQEYQYDKLGQADDWSDADNLDFFSFDQAVAKARAKLAVLAEDAADKTNRPWTVGQAVEDYLAYLEAEKKTARDVRYKCEAFILPKFADRAISSLTVDELRKWRNALAETPARIRTAKGGKQAKDQQYRKPRDEEESRRRKSTANRTLAMFKAALNRAFKDGKVKSDGVWRRVEPFRSVDAARQDFLSVAEAQRVINASPPDFRQLVQAALLTGARYGELCRLKIQDFDKDNETLVIQVAKSGKARDVILTKEGIAFFSNITAGRKRDETMLRKADGSPWQTSHQIRLMKDTCARAKIIPAVGFHALRHSWASLAVMGGTPLLVVAGNLGHRDTQMVEHHYGHLTRAYQKAEIQKGAPVFGIKIKSNVTQLPNAKR